jgi:hypothetical protein
MKKLLMVLALVTLGASCAKKSDNNNTNTNTNSGYQLGVNGQCIQTSTGQQVPYNYCSQTSNTGYQLGVNGQCIQTSTGQQVPYNYCSQAGGTGQACYGIYIYNGQQVLCSGSDCSGWTLIQAQTGQQVLCQ